jgi:hypothetical protein
MKAPAFVRDFLRSHPRLERAVRLAVRRRRAHSTAHPRWREMLGADYPRYLERRQAAVGGPKVLIATSVGAHWAGTSLESLLGAALSVRGAEAHVLLCDRALPACLHCDSTWYPDLKRFAEHGPARDLCHHCFEPAEAMYAELGLPVHRYGALVDATDRDRAAELARTVAADAIDAFTLDGVALGEHALAGALRFFARASLDGEPTGEAVLRRYFHAALLATFAVTRLLRRERYTAAVFHHGIYVPQGLIGEVCRREGVRVVNWNPAYRKRCFIFSHDQTYHHALMTEPTDLWSALPWDAAREEGLMRYLKSRWYGTQDWIWFHERPVAEMASIAREVGADFSRPCIGLLTNVMWDAQLHYPANAFPDMLAWVAHTIQWFAAHPQLQLVIRVHPAEIRGTLPSRQPLVAELRRVFPALPPNVFLIGPESNVSTYAVMERCNAVVIYGTKTGVELTSMGIPVIVAGEAWIRNKGLTLDARTVAEYDALLARLPLPAAMDEATIRQARRYAYHFFFRRMIPVDAMQPAPGNPPYRAVVTGLRDLERGSSAGLDVVCDGILTGSEFVYPAESHDRAAAG